MTDRMGRLAALLLLGSFVLAALALTGCREEDQGRILLYDKGVYQGKTDAPLSDRTVGDLRQRAREVQEF